MLKTSILNIFLCIFAAINNKIFNIMNSPIFKQVILFILVLSVAGCNKPDKDNAIYPVDLKTTLFSLSDGCTWNTLTSDSLYLINSQEELVRHIACQTNVIPDVDFSKNTVLVLAPKRCNIDSKIEKILLQQQAAKEYLLAVDVIPDKRITGAPLIISLLAPKLAENATIALTINKPAINIPASHEVMINELMANTPSYIDRCIFDNPLTDLPWLKEYIDALEFVVAMGESEYVRIYQCTYIDGIGFLLCCVDCIDGGFDLMNCKGEYLCTLGGWGALHYPCTEFNINFENKQLIWEINSTDLDL